MDVIIAYKFMKKYIDDHIDSYVCVILTKGRRLPEYSNMHGHTLSFSRCYFKLDLPVVFDHILFSFIDSWWRAKNAEWGFLSKFSGESNSATDPFESTRIRSLYMIVLSLCAMVSTVHFLKTLAIVI